MNMNTTREIRQAWGRAGRPWCTHEDYEQERHPFGADTGDWACTACGTTWWRNSPKPAPDGVAPLTEERPLKELMTSTGYGFRKWLMSYRETHAPIGHFALDVERDDTWPVGGEYQEYFDYLVEVGAEHDALEAFREAWILYCGEVPPEVYESY